MSKTITVYEIREHKAQVHDYEDEYRFHKHDDPCIHNVSNADEFIINRSREIISVPIRRHRFCRPGHTHEYYIALSPETEDIMGVERQHMHNLEMDAARDRHDSVIDMQWRKNLRHELLMLRNGTWLDKLFWLFS